MTKHKNLGEQGAYSETNISDGEIERRLISLENSMAETRKSQLDSHKWFVTLIFGLVGIFLAYTANHSATEVNESVRDMKADVHQTITDMQAKVDKSTSDLDAKFATLAGEALKKPLAELFYQNIPLDNQTIVMNDRVNYSPTPATLNSIFIKNIGDKRTEPLSIQIALAFPVQLYPDKTQGWEQGGSSETNFLANFYSTRHDSIAPQETLNIHPLVLMANDGDPRTTPPASSPILCKIKVFYGGDKPVEAKFNVIFK